CARVAISQSTTPAAIADLKAAIEGRKKELSALERETELGRSEEERIGELKTEIADTEAKLAAQEGEYGKEKGIVDEIMAMRAPPTARPPPTALPQRRPLQAWQARQAFPKPRRRHLTQPRISPRSPASSRNWKRSIRSSA